MASEMKEFSREELAEHNGKDQPTVYVGCEGNMNTGKVKGMKSNQVMSGTWSGTVDSVAIGGSFQGFGTGHKIHECVF